MLVCVHQEYIYIFSLFVSGLLAMPLPLLLLLVLFAG